MIHKHFGDHVPPFDDIRKSPPKMLVIIVNRGDIEKTTSFLREKHFHIQLICLAQGTAGSEILDMLGLGSSDKAVFLCVSPGFRIAAVLPELTDMLKLKKAGKGIAFTIPLTGISFQTPFEERHKLLGQWQEKMEEEVDKMNDSITHSMILAVVNQGDSEELVEVARAAGATGGTVINAKRAGMEETVKFFGISVQAEKEIVAILTTRDLKPAIMKAINESFGAKSETRGIILSLPVDSVIGQGGN